MAGKKPVSQSVRQASALLAVTALFSNALGLVRNVIFSRIFPHDQLDIYLNSFRVADFVFNLLIVGAISSAFIPALSELIAHKKDEEAEQLTNQLLSLATVFFIVLAVVLALAMPALIGWLVPKYPADKQLETVRLSRILLLQSVFFSWSYILGGLLNVYRRFTSYSLAPLVYTGSIILGGLVGARHGGILAITWGVVIGSFLHFLIQYRESRQIGFRFRFLPRFSPEVRHIVTVMIPRSISQGVTQLVLIAYTAIASGLPGGSFTIFYYMNDLQTAPTVIIGNSLAAAFFPSLAAQLAVHDEAEGRRLFTKVVRSALFVLLPTLALLLILRAQIVRLYIASGHSMTWEQTDIAIRTLVWFLVGVVPASLVAILARVFYALKETWVPMFVSLASGSAAVLTAYLGIAVYHQDIATLAAAESLISIIQCVAYLWILHARNSLSFDIPALVRPFATYALGALLLAGACWASLQAVDWTYRATGIGSTLTVLGLFVQAGLAACVGTAVYFGYSTLRSKEELQWLRRKGL